MDGCGKQNMPTLLITKNFTNLISHPWKGAWHSELVELKEIELH